MKKGNVLVVGNSGVGKSTLINAVLGKDCAQISWGWGISGTTKKLEIYESENEDVPFRVIDTIGFEPSPAKARKAIDAVKKWSKECAKKENYNNQINVIWLCIEGTKDKLFPEDIKRFKNAIKMWPSVPVIVVITKSYSCPERDKNIELVKNAFEELQRKNKNLSINVRKIIPVVAKIFMLNEHAFAAPEGITELIEETNKLMPEGLQAAKDDIETFVLSRKRALAQSVIAASTGAGAVIGAIPIPFADALILAPVEKAEVNLLAKIYQIDQNEKSKKFLNAIVEVGTVGEAAKVAIEMLKISPGLKLGASIMNAVIASVIVFVLGECSIYAFEQIYLGNKSVADLEWIQKFIKDTLSPTIVGQVKTIFESISDDSSIKDIVQIVIENMKKTVVQLQKKN